MKNYYVYLLAIINATIVGLSFLFTKTAISYSNPLDTLAFRFSISFLVLTLLLVFKIVKVDFSKKSFKRLALIGLFYPILFFSFQAFGLNYSQSSEAGILFASTPILTAILASIFLKERTILMQRFFILLSVFGVVFIFSMKGRLIDISNFIGIILLFFSCLSISGYTVMARSFTNQFKPLEITYFMIAFGFLFFNGASVYSHLQRGTIGDFFTPWLSPSFIVSIVFLGIFASLLTSFLSNYILSKIKASQMSVFSNLSTIVSIIAGAIFLKESIHWFDIVGSIFIILGVIGTNIFEKDQSIRLDTQPTTSIDSTK
jgi:drug/metabolite transporter (DMT)-like permease